MTFPCIGVDSDGVLCSVAEDRVCLLDKGAAATGVLSLK